MSTYYVLAFPCANDPSDELIVTSIFNPSPGQVLATFTTPESSIPFNPLTILTDGRIEDVQRLEAETYEKAKAFLANLS